MNTHFEQFFNGHRGLAIAILLFAASVLIFVIPEVFFFFTPAAKKMFWVTFLISFGSILLIFFRPRPKKDVSPNEKVKFHSAAASYQQLLDKAICCSRELKKYQKWAYGCLIMGWVVLWVGKWSEYPPYNHPIFAIPIFVLTFLAATKFWEKENELDMSIVKCAVEGMEIEKTYLGLELKYFHNLANSYKGSGMWRFAFIRISPAMMVIFSLLYAGPLDLFTSHLSIPHWVVSCGSGVILGASGLLFAKTACQPYYWLLERVKTIRT